MQHPHFAGQVAVGFEIMVELSAMTLLNHENMFHAVESDGQCPPPERR